MRFLWDYEGFYTYIETAVNSIYVIEIIIINKQKIFVKQANTINVIPLANVLQLKLEIKERRHI